MNIFIWTSFAILIEQAICFPGFDFGSLTNDPGVSEDFLNDLKKLVSETGLAEDDQSLQEMLNGLLNMDLSQAPQNNPAEKTETPSPIPSLYPGVPELTDPNHPSQPPTHSEPSESLNVNQSLQTIPPSAQIRPETSSPEMKSLAEWTQIDRENALGRRRQQKIPLLTEGDVQQPPSSSVDALNSSTEILQPAPQNEPIQSAPENQPIQSDLGIAQNPDHIKSPVSVPGEVHGHDDSDDDLDDSKFVEWLTSMTEPKPTPMIMSEPSKPIEHGSSTYDGGYVSSAGWIEHSADPNESQHEVEEDHNDHYDHDDLSSSWLSKLRDWGSFINPFA
ncbi:uncharacterized protein LOC135847802 isoform X2 [Planococcus citri]|uniref:uncharacterized protein LOC135847802 isoform X2 n=1 Tax=Planococcus citri TaxID=170843 RepID=UPI0031F8EF76